MPGLAGSPGGGSHTRLGLQRVRPRRPRRPSRPWSGADGDQSDVALDAVPGDQVGLLLEHVSILSGPLGVLDLPDPGRLRRVRQIAGLRLSDLPGRHVDAYRIARQRERLPHLAGTEDRREEAGIHRRARPPSGPQHSSATSTRSRDRSVCGLRIRTRKGASTRARAAPKRSECASDRPAFGARSACTRRATRSTATDSSSGTGS